MHLETPRPLPPDPHTEALFATLVTPTLPGVGKGASSVAASDLPGHLTQASKELSLPLWKMDQWLTEACAREGGGGTWKLLTHRLVLAESPVSRAPGLEMGTENESPEPDCQKQFQAAVSVIQNLPKDGEVTGTHIWGPEDQGLPPRGL